MFKGVSSCTHGIEEALGDGDKLLALFLYSTQKIQMAGGSEHVGYIEQFITSYPNIVRPCYSRVIAGMAITKFLSQDFPIARELYLRSVVINLCAINTSAEFFRAVRANAEQDPRNIAKQFIGALRLCQTELGLCECLQEYVNCRCLGPPVRTLKLPPKTASASSSVAGKGNCGGGGDGAGTRRQVAKAVAPVAAGAKPSLAAELDATCRRMLGFGLPDAAVEQKIQTDGGVDAKTAQRLLEQLKATPAPAPAPAPVPAPAATAAAAPAPAPAVENGFLKEEEGEEATAAKAAKDAKAKAKATTAKLTAKLAAQEAEQEALEELEPEAEQVHEGDLTPAQLLLHQKLKLAELEAKLDATLKERSEYGEEQEPVSEERIDEYAQLEQELQGMTPDACVALAEATKASGTEDFKAGRHAQAEVLYRKALNVCVMVEGAEWQDKDGGALEAAVAVDGAAGAGGGGVAPGGGGDGSEARGTATGTAAGAAAGTAAGGEATAATPAAAQSKSTRAAERAGALRTLQLGLQLNLALVYLKLGSLPMLQNAVARCTDALLLEPSSAKALFRRATALDGMGEFARAEADLLAALAASAASPGGADKAVARQLAATQQKRRKHAAREKKMWGAAFG
jgi:hypothetical protein